MNLLIGRKMVLAQPANPSDHIVAIGRASGGDPLCLGRQQTSGVDSTFGIGAVTRATGNRQNLTQSLHDFISLETIATDEEGTARGTTHQLGMVDTTLLDI